LAIALATFVGVSYFTSPKLKETNDDTIVFEAF